ncbi:hypothetical protein VTK73DRAFT_3141 [Phialemonium thermophilum]|uniref:Exonuclease domain-containing protein n=1 Tax=Phialemonium thermophilum TaxID=223376 RepID=A0ABR3X153_9PEZI
MDAISAVLRNFKTIPCPQGDKCTQANCKWKHSWDQVEDRTTNSGNEDKDTDQAGPRKRLKLEERDSVQPVQYQALSKADTVKKPVSPPPLKRKAPPVKNNRTPSDASRALGVTIHSAKSTHSAGGSPLTRNSGTATAPGSISNTRTGSAPLKKSAPKPPRKPEPLNPRHMKTSPATHDFRYKALKMLHDQFVRLNKELEKDASEKEKSLVLSDQELIWMALDEEESIALGKAPIYSNVIKNRIMTYKRMSVAKWKEERQSALKKDNPVVLTAQQEVQERLGAPKVIDTGLTPYQEVKFLSRLLTPIDQLSQFGYVTTIPTADEVREAQKAEEDAKGWEVCDRCGTRFQVFPGRREDGALTSGGKCTYHPGKTYFPERQLGDSSRVQKRWRCCKEAVGDTPGCTKAETHVFKVTHPKRLSAILPFVETPPNPLAPTDRAVCFDCEMGYTVKGLELIRLTATSWPDGAELLDVLVQPLGEILDLNSRYSGVWPEDIINAKPFSLSNDVEETDRAEQEYKDKKAGGTEEPEGAKKRKKLQIVSSPVVARDLLFSLISPSTPLIGHGLENDLNAARVVHPTVIDTVLLYPHKRGLPIRFGLKALMETRLNRAIQVEAEGKIEGHDSAEDARAAGDLVRLKVQEEWARLKGLGWTLKDGKFVPPGGKRGGQLTEEFLEKPVSS